MRIFDGFLDVEEADRLSPFKSETPKSRENSRFWASSDYTRHPTGNKGKGVLYVRSNLLCYIFSERYIRLCKLEKKKNRTKIAAL